MFPSVDFNALLAQKYKIMQQQADADTTRANAGLLTAQSGSNLDTVRAGLLPQEQETQNAYTAAQTRGIDLANKYVGPLAEAEIAGRRAGASQSLASAGLYGAQAAGENIFNRGLGGDFMDYLRRLQYERQQRDQRYSSTPGL